MENKYKDKKSQSILILGAYGFLGTHLSRFLKLNGHKVYRHGRHKRSELNFSLDNKEFLEERITKLNLDTVINLIANTNVDLCSDNPFSAMESNILPLIHLCPILEKLNIYFVHISSDQVYSGTGPHVERKANPINVYGASKFTSEFIASSTNSCVVRTNFVGKSISNNSFSDWIVTSIRSNQVITLFDDILFNPIHVIELCNIINFLSKKRILGVYNIGNRDYISKAKFGLKLIEKLNLEKCNVKIGSVDSSKSLTKRPKDMRLDITKALNILEKSLPNMIETIELLCRDYS